MKKKPNYNVGIDFRDVILKYGYAINSAIQIGGDFNSTIFNLDDDGGIIISQDFKDFKVSEYNDKVSRKVKFYNGGFGINYPKLDIFCMTTSMDKIGIPTDDNNYYVFINNKNMDAYADFAKGRECIFCNYRVIGRIGKDETVPPMDDNVISNSIFGGLEYDLIDKYIIEDEIIYYLSFHIPSNSRTIRHGKGSK